MLIRTSQYGAQYFQWQGEQEKEENNSMDFIKPLTKLEQEVNS